MNFWKKIFGTTQHKEEQRGATHQKPTRGLNEQLLLEQELEKLVKPLIRKATRIIASAPTSPPQDSQFISHFGGQPYFEQEEEWPVSKNNKPMDFIFQIFNDEGLVLPKEIKLVQFFYDWEEFPWDTENDGWLVKVYEELKPDQVKRIDKPDAPSDYSYCEIQFEDVRSLPDWEGLDLYSNEAFRLSCTINEDKPWDSYDKVVEKLIGNQHYQSRLGGYPSWIQGESTPKTKDGNKMPLLFQIDSEDNAGIMWGDVGIVYIFYDNVSKQFEFTLQCH